MNNPTQTASLAAPHRRRLETRHWVFIGSMVALDFATGQLSKSLLHASGISNVVRLDMAIPVILWMLTRLIIDRFGVLTAYQFAWGTLAIFAFPGAILPGPLKLTPAVIQGLFHDAGFSLFPRLPRARVFISAIVGGFLSKVVVTLLRVQVLHLPWTKVTQTLFGIQAATSVLVSAAAAALALVVWARIRNLQITRMLQVEN
ncbi:MAG TPA: hypothetical protein VMP11_01100 [Verrucomicrobiae bacterium]|nr:hypothetical protein [Verrucomicrobiae bacterium]